MSPRSSPPNRSSRKTDGETRLASSLRSRARAAFVALLNGFQHADRDARGALSRGREQHIHSALVTAVMNIVVTLFAEARGIAIAGEPRPSLRSLHQRLAPSRQATLIDTYDAWALFVGQGPLKSASVDIALPDAVVWRLLDALLVGDGAPVDFSELDVEHIGTFYEGLMAFDSLDSSVHYDISSVIDVRDTLTDDRRRLGAHYTSRVITRIVVERALRPLMASLKSPDEFLALRVCDPAMGSGAFLLESCRYLAEQFLLLSNKDGQTIEEARRLVAQHCLHGVDKNPRAAELARWALWILTADGKSGGVFLDKTVRAGDSLVGRPGGEKWFSQDLPPKFEKRAVQFLARHQPFHWDVEFADVVGRGGFDAFIGNPPWVSYAGRAAQPLEDDLRKYYREMYPSFAGYRNLQALFLSRCAALLRPSGRLGFVLPSSMSELGGYAPTRQDHERHCECDEDLPDFGDVFDDVFQPSMALLSTRRPEIISVDKPRPWPLHRTDLTDAAVSLLERLAAFPTFPSELFGERGFQSMGDDIDHLHALEAPTRAFRAGVRVGGDIEPFLCRAPKFYCDPSRFGARFRPAEDWQNVRLLIRQTARFPMVAVSDGQAFRNSILAGFSSETWSEFFLLAWLNSSPIRWIHYVRNRDARQGMPQVKIAHLRALPAPRAAEFVARIETLGRAYGQRNAGISAEEQSVLDELVAEALEITLDERTIIHDWVKSIRGS